MIFNNALSLDSGRGKAAFTGARSGQFGGPASGEAVVLTRPSGATPGDFCLLVVISENAAPLSGTTGFTEVFSGSAGSHTFRILTGRLPAGDVTFTVPIQSTVSLLCYRNAGFVGVLGASAGGLSDSVTAPGITTTTSEGILIAVYHYFFNGASATVTTPPAGMTLRTDVIEDSRTLVYDEQLGAAGSTGGRAITFSASATNSLSGKMLAIR